MWRHVKRNRFHGRHESEGKFCDWPDCSEPGEFRAPGVQPAGFDGPGVYRWFCLDHIREFNAGYDFFEGMDSEEILRAQSPLNGWDRETRAFRPDAGVDSAPRWADFSDPLDAISARARKVKGARRADWEADQRFSPEERRALDLMALSPQADRRALRERYSQLLHQYHPDRNGGDRSMEQRLQEVVESYQLLRKAAAFR